MTTITSPQNQKIKDAARLRNKGDRIKQGVFIVEGEREIRRALEGGFEPKELFFCRAQLSPAAAELHGTLSSRLRDCHEVSKLVFEKLAIREDTDGLFAVFAAKERGFGDLAAKKAPLLLVLETVEKPGNLGALLRTADGAGCDGVVVLDRSTDIFNPNAIRASIGTVFSQPVFHATTEEFLNFCRERGIQTLAATPRGDGPYHAADMTKGTAILLGSEAEGLSGEWLARADKKVLIPMRGSADSLNVSVAGAVLLYEAIRQRGL